MEATLAQKTLIESMSKAIGDETVSQAQGSLTRMEQAGEASANDFRVLLPFGGGKDSAWTLAYVRLMQLLAQQRYGTTFKLDVLMMVHPGVPQGVFDNVLNIFNALEIYDNADISVSIVSGHRELKVMRADALEKEVRDIFREEIVFSGHLSQGNGRETFCNGCNLNLMNSVARYVNESKSPIDFVITGDSGDEYVAYWKWVQKTARKFNIAPIKREDRNWGGMFGKLSELNDTYYNEMFQRETHGGTAYEFPNVLKGTYQIPEYFSVFGETKYEYWAHTDFLSNFLGFELKSDAFNFTESDCRNPALMAYLRGLLADFEGRGYLAGMEEYLDFITGLMEKKQYNEEMINRALKPYASEELILKNREEMEAYAMDSLGINTRQLQSIVASPLADNFARLPDYLTWTENTNWESTLRVYFVMLEKAVAANQEISSEVFEDMTETQFSLSATVEFVQNHFGLRPENLVNLLRSNTISVPRPQQKKMSKIEILRGADPHKKQLTEIEGRANNLITGR